MMGHFVAAMSAAFVVVNAALVVANKLPDWKWGSSVRGCECIIRDRECLALSDQRSLMSDRNRLMQIAVWFHLPLQSAPGFQRAVIDPA